MRAISTSYGVINSDTIIEDNHVSNVHKSSDTSSSYGLQSIISRKNVLNFKESKKSAISVQSDHHKSAAQEIIIHADRKDYNRGPENLCIYRGDHSSNTARAFSEGRIDAHSVSEDSNNSTKIIIKKEVQWFIKSNRNTISTVNISAALVEIVD